MSRHCCFPYVRPGRGLLAAKDWICIALVVLVVSSGCEVQKSHTSARRRRAEEALGQTHIDDFIQAIDFLHHIGEFNPVMSRRQVMRSLNRWMSRQSLPETWTVDPLYEVVPKRFAIVKQQVEVPRLHFDEPDIIYLQEQMFLRDIASSVIARPVHDSPYTPWLMDMKSQWGEDAAANLATATRLFDWTVRNIQLTPMPPWNRQKRDLAGPQLPGENSSQKQVAKPRSEPGPGERFFSWESLLVGEGDAIDRARIFILLARQEGIPAVMLALEDDEYVEPRPWLPAVLIQDKLFLFDMQLGLPVPGPDGVGIVNLDQVIEDPSLLRALDVDEKFQYPVSVSNLRRVVAWIDADPMALSRRMQIVERRLTGGRRMALTASPSLLVQRLQDCSGISRSQIWELSYQRRKIRQKWAEEKDEEAQRAVHRKLIFIVQPTPLLQGRILHFQGIIAGDHQQPGAKGLYMDSRPPDTFIRRLATDKEMQRTAKLNHLTPQQLAANISLMVARKQAASYWLGLVSYENGDYATARNWFESRTLKATSRGPWTDGARYNLARTHEMLGEPEKARHIYVSDKSPQRHGNLLRARALEAAKKAEAE